MQKIYNRTCKLELENKHDKKKNVLRFQYV